MCNRRLSAIARCNHSDNNDDNPEIALVIDHNLPQCDGWRIASGASQHMTFDKKGMHKYVAFTDPLKLKYLTTVYYWLMGKEISMFQYMMGQRKWNCS